MNSDPKPKSVSQSKPSRDISLDLLRGVAVILMIITHVNGLLYSGDSGFVDFFTYWGATLCFSIFIFVSGAVYGIKIYKDKLSNKKLLKRMLVILGFYYIAAFVLFTIESSRLPGLLEIGEILLLIRIQSYVEFLLAFVFFAAILILVNEFIANFIKKCVYFLPVLGILIYILSTYLNSLDWGTGLGWWFKNHLISNSELHTFGILPYSVPFIIGLFWGIVRFKYSKSVQNYIKIGFFLFTFWLAKMMIFKGVADWSRWPPSVFLLAHGISFSFGFLIISDLVKRIKPLNQILLFFSKNALLAYVTHIVIVFGLSYTIGFSYSKWSDIVILNTAVLFVTWLITKVMLLLK